MRRSPLLAVLLVASLSSLLVWASRPQQDTVHPRLAAAYQRGLAFLAAVQRQSGDFPTYHWPTENPAKAAPVETVFTVSQILYSLNFNDRDSIGSGIKELAGAYLLSQKEPPGLWRYYGKAGPHLLSPDVDDTAVAWAALAGLGHRISDAALEAVRASRNATGVFNTWVGNPATWVGIDSRDVDMVVNLNALLLFALAGDTVAEVCDHAVGWTKSGAFRRGSVYYPSPLAFTYALSRAYADGGATCLANAVSEARASVLGLQQPDGGWGNDLETALGVVTLLNAGYQGPALDRGVPAILNRQAPDGGWALAPAYRAAVLPVSYGSRALTTALSLEALAKYGRRQ